MKPLYTLPLLLLAACETAPRDPLSQWGDYVPAPGTDPGVTDTDDTDTDTGETDTGTPVEPDTLRVQLTLPYDHRFGRQADQADACTLEVDDDELAVTTCQLDANELDLYFHGWSYELVVPANTCDYLGIDNYKYQAWESGVGPTIVEWVEDSDGNWIEDRSNALNGKPFCEYDYKAQYPALAEAPNCCYGTYQVRVIVRDGQGNEQPGAPGDPEDWGGGPLGDCYAGAAFSSSITAIDPVDNLPRYILVDIDETVNTTYGVSFDAPISKPESSNVTIVNYLDPADAVPDGLTAQYARQSYVVECLDHAQEVRARIHLVLREWDEVSEFDAEGDPDSGLGGVLEPNGSGSPINDWYDWRDFARAGVDYVQFMD